MRVKLSGPCNLYIILTIFVVILLISARQYTYEVRLVPFLIGIPTLLLLAVLLIDHFYPEFMHMKKKEVPEQVGEEMMEGVRKATATLEFTPWLPVLRIIGWIILLFVLIFFLGHFLVSPVFIMMFFIIEVRIRWRRAFIISVISTGILYSFISILLKVELWTGAIPEIIPGILGGAIIPPI